jgi:hypothetical protein
MHLALAYMLLNGIKYGDAMQIILEFDDQAELDPGVQTACNVRIFDSGPHFFSVQTRISRLVDLFVAGDLSRPDYLARKSVLLDERPLFWIAKRRLSPQHPE